ncbi:enoyl-CoA hydratase-related protein [Sunxiuqinia sp. A32]|uniref:enoyl-CoA hydratase-related protein n=1 Tax=Sunxiuqinia sp. A32 TaxID=3461496 RepID=UPI0040462B6B
MKVYKYIKLKVDGVRADIILNRPDKHNALFTDMIVELNEALEKLSGVDELRFIVLSGEGSSFCTGADIEWFSNSIQKSKSENWEEYLQMANFLKRLYEMPQVTIAAAHRNVLGGGNGIVAACDFAVAEQSTAFAFGEVKLGVIPATIMPFVAKRVSIQNLKKLFYSGERFWATEAQLIGLIDFLSEDGKLQETVDDLVKGLIQVSPNALKACKKMLQKVASGEVTVESGEYTSAVLTDLVLSPDGQEGMNSFLEKRTPSWRVFKAEEN